MQIFADSSSNLFASEEEKMNASSFKTWKGSIVWKKGEWESLLQKFWIVVLWRDSILKSLESEDLFDMRDYLKNLMLKWWNLESMSSILLLCCKYQQIEHDCWFLKQKEML